MKDVLKERMQRKGFQRKLHEGIITHFNLFIQIYVVLCRLRVWVSDDISSLLLMITVLYILNCSPTSALEKMTPI